MHKAGHGRNDADQQQRQAAAGRHGGTIRHAKNRDNEAGAEAPFANQPRDHEPLRELRVRFITHPESGRDVVCGWFQ
jgi:hypothetical protein